MRLKWGFLIPLLACGAWAQAPSESAELRWMQISAPGIVISGLPWYGENGGELFRLPAQLKDTYNKSVWSLAQSPSGGRIRFRTNSRALAIRLEYPHPPGMLNMHAFGQSGVDLYVGNTYWGTATADKNAHPGKIYEHVYFNFPDRPRAEREITIYLPLYEGVKVLGLGVDAAAEIKPPRPFALDKPVVYYGTSITQGGCASRPAMDYEAILGRRLNIDFVNLGFSGTGKYEPELARAVASIDASCFVLDSSNIKTVEELRKVYAPFIETIRSKHPDTPILAISPIYSTQELTDDARKRSDEERRTFTREVISQRIAGGDRNIQLIEGTDLLGPHQGDGLVDGTHPNDLGFHWIADALTGRLASVLGLNVDR